MRNRRAPLILLFCAFFALASQAYAANCGGVTACSCGDTVTSAYVVASDLNCTGSFALWVQADLNLYAGISSAGDGLVIKANSVTIDGNGYTMAGDGGGGDYGIDNSGQYDNITVQNFGEITNFDYGAYIFGCSGCTVKNNSFTSNTEYGLNFGGITGIITSALHSITGNTVSSNRWGVYFSSTTSTELANNTVNLNSDAGITLGGGSSSNTLTDNNINANQVGVDISGSGNTLAGNTLNENTYGIKITLASNDISDNNLSRNTYGIYTTASSNAIANNTFSRNATDVYDNALNAYGNNFSLHNASSRMANLAETSQINSLNDTVNFTIEMSDLNGTACQDCSYSLSLSPAEETFTHSKTGNEINGSFVATRKGIYSLITEITDANNNATERNYSIYVDADQNTTVRYYFRGTVPAYSYRIGNSHDSKSLLLTLPDTNETWYCANWVQNSPDELPDYPLGILTGVDANAWYKQTKSSGAYAGIQQYVTYDAAVDYNTGLAVAADYESTKKTFSGMGWTMDYPTDWYWLAIKFYGTNIYMTTYPSPEYQDRPSFADLNYTYSASPAIRSITNNDILILSATAAANDTNNALIVLDGTGDANIALGNYNRPFLDHNTTITGSNATIKAKNLGGVTDLNSVAMDIIPDTGSIDVNIQTWNTSGTYYKKWAETGSATGISAYHTAYDLDPGKHYKVLVDTTRFHTYLADGSGKISFTYDGGYSEKTFEIEEESETTPPVTTDNDFNNIWNSADQNIQLSCTDTESGCKNLHYSIDDANRQAGWGDSNIGIEITTDGNHTVFYWSSDSADNNESAHVIYAALDKSGPTMAITSPPNGHTQKATTVTLYYGVTDTNSGIAKYYVKADTGSWIDNNTNTSYAFTNQSAATHTYQAKAVDNAGNETTAQITTTIEPTDNRASSTPGGSTGTTPAGTTTIFTTQKTGTPTEQQIEQTLAQAGYTQQQINSTMQTAKNTPTTQTATATRETGITGTSYRAKITIAIANNSANKWREIKVIAEIPKTIAENAGLIDSNSPFTALKADPIIQFIIPEIQAGQTREISYSVAKNTPESTAQSIPQAIVASYAQTEPCDGVSCDEGNACATGTCNNATGKCEYSYEQDGTACGENKKCVQGTCAEKQDSQAGSSRPTDPQQQPENAPAAGLAIILPAVLAIAIIAAAGYYWHTRSRP